MLVRATFLNLKKDSQQTKLPENILKFRKHPDSAMYFYPQLLSLLDTRGIIYGALGVLYQVRITRSEVRGNKIP